jgi:hypothetical protein
MSKNLSTTLALAAAAMFLGGCEKKDAGTTTPAPEAAPASSAKIKCFGANTCEAQGQCNVPDGRVEPGSKGHACAGQNACQGKGWLSLNATECAAKGGEPL